MTIFGKIMAVLNILAAAGFGYLAFQSYSQRQLWAYAVFRYELALEGLPVDKTETIEGEGLSYERITETVQSDLQINAPTQEEIFAQVERKAKDNLASGKLASPNPQAAPGGDAFPGNAVQKRIFLLLQLARSSKERLELVEIYRTMPPQIPDATGKPAPLAQAIQSRVEASLSSYKSMSTPGEKKARIAFLWASLLDILTNRSSNPFSSPEMTRFVTVVGVRQAASALQRRAQSLRAISYQLREVVRPEARLDFIERYDRLIARLRNAEQANLDLQREVRAAELNRQKYEDLANDQETKLKKKMMELATLQGMSEKELDLLRETEQRLFRTLLELRDANVVNQRMEQEIRDLVSKLR